MPATSWYRRLRNKRKSARGLLAAGLLGGLLMLSAPGPGVAPQTAAAQGQNHIEIDCGKSQDQWQPIVTLGPIDAADEEAYLSEMVKVTLKYLFLQGSQRQRLTIRTKWTINAKVVLEINPKQLCASQGTTGVRTTITGQTQTSDGKVVLPPGYIRILPEQLD